MITTYWNERIYDYLQNAVSEFTLETRYEDTKHTVKLQRADSKTTSWYATIETYRKGELMCTDYVARIFAHVDCFGEYAEECFYVATYGYKKYSLFRKAKTINKGYLSTFTTSNYSEHNEMVTYIDDEETRRLRWIDDRIERKFNNGNLEVREGNSFDTFMRVTEPIGAPSVLLINKINDLVWERYKAEDPYDETNTAAVI